MNMTKKKNSSGFTLVELIVVMCLMGIIMGAVLNFIQPTASLYKSTNAYLNEEESVSMISDYLQDDLLYATGVYIYAADPAVPEDADINQVYNKINSTLDTPIQPTNCIVLNNTSIRSDYSVAAAKGATGSIQKYALNGTRYYDVTENDVLLANNKLYTNNFALRDQTFMDDDKFFFSVDCDYNDGAVDKVHAMRVTMDVYRPVYNGNAYNYDELTFSATKAVEFINLSAGRTTFTSHFAASSNNTPYIYIFYDRKDKITNGAGGASRINYKCYILDANSDPITYFTTPTLEGSAPVGSDISKTVQDLCDASIELSFEKDGKVYMRTGEYAYSEADMVYDPDKLYANLSNLSNPAGGTELALYAVYDVKQLADMPKSTVKFYALDDRDGTSSPNEIKEVEYGSDVSSTAAPWITDTDDPGAGIHTYQVWCDVGTDNIHESFSKITTDVSVYKKKITKYYVWFVDAEGNRISWATSPDSTDTTDHLEITSGEAIPQSSIPDPQNYGTSEENGEYSWVFDGGPYDGQPNGNAKVIDGPTTMKLVFVPNSTPTPPTPPTPPDDSEVQVGSCNKIDIYYNDRVEYQSWNNSYVLSFNTLTIVNSNTDLKKDKKADGYIPDSKCEILIELNTNIEELNINQNVFDKTYIKNVKFEGGVGQNYYKITFDIVNDIQYDSNGDVIESSLLLPYQQLNIWFSMTFSSEPTVTSRSVIFTPN